MKKVDYIIVGGGYAGFFFAHQLIKNNKSFLLFLGSQTAASKVSAGVINPAVLKKFTTFWLAQEQIDFLKHTLSEMQGYTNNNYLISETVHRIFHDENERNLWLKKSESDALLPFLSTQFKTFDDVLNPFGTGEVLQSARLNVKAFFKDFEEYLERNNLLVRENFNYDSLKDNVYQEIEFRNIIFCEGIGVSKNPYFSHIEIQPNKGHHLTVKLSKELKEKVTFKKKHFLFPLQNDTYYYGGTYDRDQQDDIVDSSAVLQLENGLKEFYPHAYEITDVEFGFRPTVKDRRPIIGSHQDHSNYYVFNGLGARGVLNGCYFAHELYLHIENAKPLHSEIDLKRFS